MRQRKMNFVNAKMLSSRVEREDYYKLEKMLDQKGVSVQEFINTMVRSFISGNIFLSGTDYTFVMIGKGEVQK